MDVIKTKKRTFFPDSIEVGKFHSVMADDDDDGGTKATTTATTMEKKEFP